MSMSMINVALMAYMAASIAYIVKDVWRGQTLRFIATGILGTALILNGIMVLGRWIDSGHAPFANLYESLVFYTLCISAVYIGLEAAYRFRVVGALASVMALLVLAYASWQDETISPLMPALQSNWLTIHVITYFIGYAAFGISFFTSIVYLVVRTFGQGGTASSGAGTADDKTMTPKTFDKLGYQLVALGFPFLTLGMITGAVWAKKAWGDYWSWDPKETWSLITWLVYLAYLHLPLVLPRMNLKKTKIPIIQCICLLIAFGVVGFTYLGLSYLPSASDSAHVYGAK